ncbi:hypothetical protein LWC33_17880 [Pseudonocardia sp. RS11V-5]|uniref:sunset domain-containing protein n=1 Tax=Pseudonocardia terrae TaxID=2905831 RepID=UPI001E5504C0|nr:hypothetical protein [Pseudonocardia terrae]MCE3553321.1 hypothetical protein [Pseudonocardia terrae]
MADRRNRTRRGILLLGVAGAAGAGAWVFWRRSGAGRPVRDQWARAVSTPSAAEVGRESVAVGARGGSVTVNGATVNGPTANGATVNGSDADGAVHNGRTPQGLIPRAEPPAAGRPTPEPPAAERPTPEPPAEKPGPSEKLLAPEPSPAEKSASEEETGAEEPPAAAAEPVPDGPYGPGSAAPLPDGSAPSPEFTIKGNASSMLFHPPSSPYFRRTKPAAWFRTAEDARRAGFTEWKPKPRGG